MEKIQKILHHFHGGKARLWHFTASHDRLVIRLTSFDKKLVKYLLFFGCNEISLPVLCDIHQPIIERVGENELQYLDEKIRIVFNECYIEDSYKP